MIFLLAQRYYSAAKIVFAQVVFNELWMLPESRTVDIHSGIYKKKSNEKLMVFRIVWANLNKYCT